MNDRAVLDVIEMASYGIGYWASSAVVDEDAKTYTVTEGDFEGRGDTETFVLTWQALRVAANKLIRFSVPVNRDILASIVNNDVDATAADVIVQVAAFGEVRYS